MLFIKLSSLGDVVHTLPAAMDVVRACPSAQIDWVVEPAFAPLVSACPAVQRIIDMDLRRWRCRPCAAQTRAAWRDFKSQLKAQAYDAVIDLQGLTKSAWVSRMARLAPGGQRIAMACGTEGSSYEAPTRWVADRLIELPWHIHAVDRGRELCARALGYSVPAQFQPGLAHAAHSGRRQAQVVCVHGTSRADKLWPESQWVELCRRLSDQGLSPLFVHGNDDELERAQRLQAQLTGSQVAPRWALPELIRQMANSFGVIGVDSGPSHIAVALGLPHVQIYNFDTAWRSGPQHAPQQISVVSTPYPSVDQVFQSWQKVRSAAR
ncbi:MAG: lipopolysaccharide heptosyltransferase I [Alphaproteobacteria bacterium]|nr:lipopolysaccharide heptosyltransferase I [Alphaproteobacteria bacterium]